MAESFEIRPFEECIEKIKYTTKIASQDFKESGRFPIISQEEAFISGYWDNPEDVFHINKPVVIFGDHSRHIKYVDFDFVIGADGVKILSPVKSINAKYFYYFLKWLDIPSLGYSRHYKALKEKSVKVFSETCQQRIVDELDLLTGIIDKKNAQLRDLDALAQSIFYEMFGDPYTNIHNWPTAFLESMVTEGCSISYGIVQPGDGEVDGVPIVRPVDLLGTFVHNKNLKKTTKEISDSYKRTILKGNELLLCVRGTTGIVSLAANDLAGCNVSRGITPLEFNNENSRWFMYYQFKTAAVQGTISELTHGIALKGINMADVRKLTMIQPPYHLQKEFEDKVMSIDAQKERIIASLQDLNSLLQSKMDGYFSE